MMGFSWDSTELIFEGSQICRVVLLQFLNEQIPVDKIWKKYIITQSLIA